METVEVDVLIVGGGACGLSSSAFLSDLGINHLLVERRQTTSHLPKAHYYNQRTMEIYRQHGIAESIYAVGMPMANCTVRYVTSLGGDEPLDRRDLYTFDGFGGGRFRDAAEKASPSPTVHLPQIGLEPILYRIAKKRAGDRVRFHHELIGFEQDTEGVTALIRNCDTQGEYGVRAKYMIAADGGKLIGPELGVVIEGVKNLAVMVTAHIAADLSPYIPGDAMITHIIHPESRFRWGVFVPAGPTWGKHSEEWAFSFAYHPDDQARLTEHDIIPAIRESMKLPDLDIKLHRVSEWMAQAVVAERFQFGRIFIAGDAAHKVIPTSGLGLNSAIHDAHNICWKLAAVINSDASESLLKTYEAERRPASLRNGEWSLFTFKNHVMVEVGLGLLPGQSPEANVAAITEYLSDTSLGRSLRARAKEIVGTQRTEYGALEIELGGDYRSSAVVPDGTSVPYSDPMGDIHIPTTRPGHRLPHAWLAWPTYRISTHDLTGTSAAFVLVLGSDGEAWRAAAAAASAALRVAIKVVSIGVGGDCSDPTGQWDEVKGIGEAGAILVRPDNIVGYRSQGSVENPEQVIKDALRTILGSKVQGPVILKVSDKRTRASGEAEQVK